MAQQAQLAFAFGQPSNVPRIASDYRLQSAGTADTLHRPFHSDAALVPLTVCTLAVAGRSWLRRRSRAILRLADGVAVRAVEAVKPPSEVQEKVRKVRERPWQKQDLPIQKLLPEIVERVAAASNLVLQAETGAGKTTMVPLAVLESGKLSGKILVLQPRRIVAVEAAKRMAELWGEPVGDTVGYRIRHDSNVGPYTQLEVITEGILLRMLQNNPTLEGVGAIFFDEFHERNLDSDMSLTLALNTQRESRPDLRLIVMSATLGGLGERLTDLMDCEKVYSEGRCFPVEVKHVGKMGELSFSTEALKDHALEHFVADQVAYSIMEHEGDILVFLPGEAEIMYTWVVLNNMGYGDGKEPPNMSWQAQQFMDVGAHDLKNCIECVPLYGSMSRDDQDKALRPRSGWRKVLLATPIAESSLTLPGVKVVIDTGLRRTVFIDPKTGISFMRTVPISAASADQRKGRAGRVSAGVCYRVWSESEQNGLQAQDMPELHLGDLCSAVLELSLARACSEQAIADLPWVDPPQTKQLKEACALLSRLKAIEHVQDEDEEQQSQDEWTLTDRGRDLASFPLHPRLAHMIFQARHVSKACAIDACHLAALLSEREILQGGRRKHGTNIQLRLDALKDDKAKNVSQFVKKRVLRVSKQLQKLTKISEMEDGPCSWQSDGCPAGVLVAWACPELVSVKMPLTTKKQMSDKKWGFVSYRTFSGNEGKLQNDELGHNSCIAIATAQDSRVFLAAAINKELLNGYGNDIANPVAHEVFGSI